MQTTKMRHGIFNVPRKTSPATPHTGRKLKTPGSDSDFLSSPSPVRKTPKDRSPNVVDRQSPRNPATEKKKPTKVSELEYQLAHLQDELKKAKDQLISSESCKEKAQQEADEVTSQLTVILTELEKTQKQLNEHSDSEDAQIQELRKISLDRDKAWQSELEAVQKQQAMDSSALASALNGIQRLKFQLNKISELEASQARHAESAHVEILSLRVELKGTLELVEKLKSQLNDSRESEARAWEEVVKNTKETLKLENGNVMELYKSLLVELEESKSKVNSLEGLFCKFQADFANASKILAYPSDVVKAENGECDRSEILKTEINNLKNEASRLRDALEDAEKRYQDQYLEMTMQIRDANDLVMHVKTESCEREAELETKLKESRTEFEQLKTKLIEKENILQNFLCVRETEFPNELKKSESVLEYLNVSLLERDY